MQWRERDGLRWLEANLGGGARVAFTTRLGGASEPPFDSLNLGLLTDDDPASVAENRRRLAAALRLDPERIALARQVHGAELLEAPSGASFAAPFAADQPNPEAPQGDGHLLRNGAEAAFVFTADCLPVALRGPGGVALLHCGWRGLAAGIVARGAAAVAATEAAIGPGIGPCCYEVGDEVAASFAGLGEGVLRAPGGDRPGGLAVSARPRFDLIEAARRLLAEAGVERVEAAGLCTACEPKLFFSHRRDAGRSGRQGALAWIEPALAPEAP